MSNYLNEIETTDNFNTSSGLPHASDISINIPEADILLDDEQPLELLEDDSDSYRIDDLSHSDGDDIIEEDDLPSTSLHRAFDSRLATYTNTALEIFSGKNLFHDLRDEIDTNSIHTVYDAFINHKPSFDLPDNDTPGSVNTHNVTNHLKNCIYNIKHQLETDFSNLLEMEQNVQESLDSLENMKTQSVKLEEFYGMIDNTEIEDKFRQLTEEAYQAKFNDGTLQKDLQEYRKQLDKHLDTIRSLREVNCLNQVPNCVLCLDKEIDHVAIPCGHTFCGTCINKCKTCGLCRRKITRCQKIFIG